MSYSKLIHEYLDGQLGDSERDALFAELAGNSDARVEFDQQVKLHSIAQNDMQAITPPIESTSAIFSSLGFSIPSAEYMKNVSGGDGAAAASVSSWSRFWKNNYKAIMSAFFASAITALFFLVNPDLSRNIDIASGINQGGNDIPVTTSVESSAGNAAGSNTDMSSFNPANTDRFSMDGNRAGTSGTESGNSGNGGNSSGSDGYIQGNSPANSARISNGNDLADNSFNTRENDGAYAHDRNESEKTKGKLAYQEILPSEYTPLSDGTLIAYYLAERHGRNKPAGNLHISHDVPTIGLDSRFVDNTDWAVEIWRFNQASEGGLNNNEALPYSNFSITGLYKVDQHHAFGFEIGRQQFSQDFTYLSGGRKIHQLQNPDLLWYGVTYRLLLPEFSFANYVMPYARVFGGGTVAGPLVRGQAGMQYRAGDVAVSVGLEGAYLFYNVQNTLYASGKYGLTVGLNYNFNLR